MYLVVYADPREPDAYRNARRRLAHLRARLAAPLPEGMILAGAEDASAAPQDTALERSFTEDQFLDAVRRSKEYIFAGDVMQVQVSQRTSRPLQASPLGLYRALRGLNPSSYNFV